MSYKKAFLIVLFVISLICITKSEIHYDGDNKDYLYNYGSYNSNNLGDNYSSYYSNNINSVYKNSFSNDYVNNDSSNYSNMYSNIYSNDYGNNYSYNYNFENDKSIIPSNAHIIGFALPNMSSAYYSPIVKYAKAEAQKSGIEIVTADAEGDANKQADQISDFIKKRVDVIILIPIDSKLLVASARMIKEANIPLINLNNKLDDTVSDLVDTYVGGNATEQGELAAELMIEALGNKGGNILIVEGVKDSDTQVSRTKGFVDRISQVLNINIIAIKSAAGDRIEARGITSEFLENGVQVDGIYAHSDNIIIGCLEAAKSLDRAGKIKFIGIGGSGNVYEYIKKGEIYGIVAQPPYWEGSQAIKCALDILDNKKVKTLYRDSIYKVTKENIDSITGLW